MKETIKSIIETLEELSKPYNLNDLVEKGILSKKGAWHTIEKEEKLPSYVLKHAAELKTETGKKPQFKIKPFSETKQQKNKDLLKQFKN